MTLSENLLSHSSALNDTVQLLATTHAMELKMAGEWFVETLKAGNTIYWCGNGGSAAESSHLATELIGRFRNNRIPLPSISLNADAVALTCIANDFGYEEVFSRQLEGLGKPGDLLISLSTSGTSPNIVRVIEQAKHSHVRSIALLGKTGGASAKLADLSIVVPHQDTARIQEIHLLIGHSLCQVAENALGF